MVLRSAGIKTHIIKFTSSAHTLSGSADLSKTLVSEVSIIIGLSPKIPKDFHSNVGEVWAAIDYSSL